MRIPKLLTALFLVSIIFSTMPAFSAVKAGATCSKLGRVVVKSGSEYRCIKKGKKLVWKAFKLAQPIASASPVLTPTPTPTPTPSPSPTPTVIPIPTQSAKPLTFAETLWSKGENGVFPIEKQVYEIPSVIPTSWQDVYEKRLGIPYQAWLSVSKNIASNTSKLGKVEILIGPNTTPNYSELKQQMELVTRAFPNARNVNNLRGFVFNFKDSTWADETFKRLYINETSAFKNRHANAVEEICPKQRQVCFAQAFVDSNFDGVIMQGMTDIGSREQLNQTFSEYARAYLGFNIAHEYLHTVQRVILGDRWYQRIYTPPSWFNEGSAVFIEGAATNPSSFDQFMRFRAVDSKVLYSDCPYQFCVKLNYELVLDFLSMSHYEKNWDNFPYAMKYEMSARTVEILVALKGADSLIGFIDYMATGKTFEQAFEFTYGISYQAAKPFIARIIVDEFSSGG